MACPEDIYKSFREKTLGSRKLSITVYKDCSMMEEHAA